MNKRKNKRIFIKFKYYVKSNIIVQISLLLYFILFINNKTRMCII